MGGGLGNNNIYIENGHIKFFLLFFFRKGLREIYNADEKLFSFNLFILHTHTRPNKAIFLENSLIYGLFHLQKQILSTPTYPSL